ncbi:MAG: extracellular solute-binding protein [Eubacteriales bacterium]|nr:extracellular solute-binding protein [Eubacteriales bacterium]
MKKRTKKLTALVTSTLMAASALTVSPAIASQAEEASTELDIFINMSWWPVDTFTGIIPEEIEAQTGVKLNLTITADSQQLGLMIASGEIPDLVFTDQELDRLSSSQFCYSYDELIEQYAPDFEPYELRVNIAKSFSTDEHYYTILNCFSTNEEWEEAPAGAPGQACIYYRKDIYEAMGSPTLETLDDFLNVCEQVQNEYPDMVPFGLGGFWKLQPISAWLGASGGNTYQMLDDGSVVHQISAPQYRDFLEYANTLAREGYITAEAYANENESDSHQMAYSGECFAYTWYLTPTTLTTMNTEAQKVNPDAEWAVLRPLGGENAMYNTSKGWAGLFISKDCKDPEKAIQFVEFMLSEEGRHLQKWGREGIEYTLDENGLPVFSEEWKETKKDPDAMNQKYNQYFYFGVTGVEENLGDWVDMDADDLADCTAYKEGYKNYPEIGIAAPASSSDEGVIEAKLEEMMKAEVARVIFSADDEEFEKNYESLMSNAEKIGVETLNSYMTEKVKEIKEQFGL